MLKIKPPARRAYAPEGHAKKITAGICLIFRGLFFEHNTDIGQKDHLWMNTNLDHKVQAVYWAKSIASGAF